MKRLSTLAAVLLFCLQNFAVRADEPADAETTVGSEKSQAELEKEFSEMLTGATLIGRYTDSSKEDEKLREDKYGLQKVTKLEGDIWLFVARIQYGKRDVTVPITLPVKWAGTTPVITVNKVVVPGIGTFDARVMFHDGQYVGTWSASDHGGLMFGRVVKEDEDQEGKANAEGKGDTR